jgi:hypothetical protein
MFREGPDIDPQRGRDMSRMQPKRGEGGSQVDEEIGSLVLWSGHYQSLS